MTGAATASRRPSRSRCRRRTEQSWRDSGKVREARQGIATGRLDARRNRPERDARAALDLQRRGIAMTAARATRRATPVPYALAHSDGDGHFTLLRLNGHVTQRLSEGTPLRVARRIRRAPFRRHVCPAASGPCPHHWSTTQNVNERRPDGQNEQHLARDGRTQLVGRRRSRRGCARRRQAHAAATARLATIPATICRRASKQIALYAQTIEPAAGSGGARRPRWEAIVTRGSARRATAADEHAAASSPR